VTVRGPAPGPRVRPQVYSVSQVLAGLRQLLEERVGRIWIAGEVSGVRRPGSGHVYFSLVDDGGQLRAALFRSSAQRLSFELEDGLDVMLYGELDLYAARGELQVVVRHVEPRGQGALQLAFEQLRRRLEAEGLFDPSRKRALPKVPRRIGLVTSASGAALRDVLQVTRRRFPAAPLLLAPTRVQGAGAEHEIAAALAALSTRDDVSVVLLVRGGGSLEDLQAFNSEAVARAVADCAVPVVCGVGHEVDVTIADLVADLRAPTPSAAAELAVPDRASLARLLDRDWRRLTRAAAARLARASDRARQARDALHAHSPRARLLAWRARLAAAGRALERAAAARREAARARLAEASARLETLSPLGVLSRGYALVRRSEDGRIVRRASQAPPGQELVVRVAEAEIDAVVRAARRLRD
jgi:exodeoxyribonuclease VII large subunit